MQLDRGHVPWSQALAALGFAAFGIPGGEHTLSIWGLLDYGVHLGGGVGFWLTMRQIHRDAQVGARLRRTEEREQ